MKVRSIQSPSVFLSIWGGLWTLCIKKRLTDISYGERWRERVQTVCLSQESISYISTAGKHNKHFIFSSLQGGFSLQCRYPGSVKTLRCHKFYFQWTTTIGEVLPTIILFSGQIQWVWVGWLMWTTLATDLLLSLTTTRRWLLTTKIEVRWQLNR